MSEFYQKILSLFKRLAFVLLLYILMRNLMYLFNMDIFTDVQFLQLLKINFFGLRFDLVAILATNALLIILYLIPFKFSYSVIYNKTLSFLFVIINSIGIIANMSDIIYLRFTLKRTTFEFIRMFQDDNQMFGLIPSFFIDFWYVAVIGFLLIGVLIWFTKRTSFSNKNIGKGYLLNFHWKASIISILIIGLTVLGIRGGTQLRPISVIDATKYASNENTNLILNTPFSLIKTIGKTKLQYKNYFTEQELNQIIIPIHNHKDTLEFRPSNVVIIIMESMSKEHSAYHNPNLGNMGFTPFLDSLIPYSFVCNQSYANGRKSIEGIPAILASFPTLFNDAFISSNYSSNKINSLASLLKLKGYSTSFYHGGNNGTMGFDNFVKSIGFNNYYGRDEYNNEDDFDGKWGIFDHKYFNYFQKQLSASPQPFLATIFSLSAHHPYTIPNEFTNKFPQGKIPIQQCIAYSDYALKEFFTSASQTDWFNNTIFVITADHTSEIADNSFNNIAGRYAIPLVFYIPGDSLAGKQNSTTQQIDIMPSILDYLNYDLPFYSLGNSVFSKTDNRNAISYNNGVYQSINGQIAYSYNSATENKFDSINLNQWPVLFSNSDGIGNLQSSSNSQDRLKAFIQIYNRDLINNNMNISNELSNK